MPEHDSLAVPGRLRHQTMARFGRSRGSRRQPRLGATGATSNPIIIADLIKTGRFDEPMTAFIKEGLDDEALAWRLTDMLVRQAQEVFLPVWESTKGNDGYVSFELDPLLEDVNQTMPVAERTKRYIALGKKWSRGHKNRMIKVPATPAGLGALEELAAAGITLNVTLIFSERQYNDRPRRHLARAQRRPSLDALQIGLQHLRQPAGRLHREARPARCRRPPRAWSASSTPSTSGSSTSSSGPTRGCRSSRR